MISFRQHAYANWSTEISVKLGSLDDYISHYHPHFDEKIREILTGEITNQQQTQRYNLFHFRVESNFGRGLAGKVKFIFNMFRNLIILKTKHPGHV